MKKGDKVRFLSETGGGIVSGFQGKDIVLVEDEDGFEIPMRINDVVVVQNDDYSSRAGMASSVKKEAGNQHLSSDGRSVKAMMKEGMDEEVATAVECGFDTTEIDKPVTFHAPVEERKGGNMLTACLAFVPVNITEMSVTDFDLYFVNDSNYYISYMVLVAEGTSWNVVSKGVVEPNTKEYLREVHRDELQMFSKTCVQMFSYKIDKPFVLKPVIDVQFRVDGVKFYKLHSFTENIYFESPALIYNIVENDKPARSLVIDAKQLKQEMYKSAEPQPATGDKKAEGYVRRYENGKKQGNPFVVRRKGDEDVIVVDLHADALLDTTAGMSAADILNYQMTKFREVLAQNKNKKRQRIVFIHGKGEGVLRRAIINDLKYRYKTYTYQDASFQEYGYGATQVTIK